MPLDATALSPSLPSPPPPSAPPRAPSPPPPSSPPSSAEPKPRKHPVLQLFVRPFGLPHLPLCVVCSSASRELARTEVSCRRDPLFDEPLELWDDASGKGASLPLTFAVLHRPAAPPPPAAPLPTLAVAHIASDKLRRLGLFNTREGAAVALPLLVPAAPGAPSAPPATLHCYVHAGYSYRPRKPRPPPADAPPPPPPPAARRECLRLSYRCRSLRSRGAADAVLLLQLRGANTTRGGVRLHGAALRLAAGGSWREVVGAAPPPLEGVELPPDGGFETMFVVQYAPSQPLASCAQSDAELCEEALCCRVLLSLPPLSALAPLRCECVQLDPSAPRAREHTRLSLQLAARGAPLGEIEVEVEAAASSDWIVMGPHTQRMVLADDVTSSDTKGEPRSLTWTVVPLHAGYLDLPTLAVWKLNECNARAERLPPPPYPFGGKVLVLPGSYHMEGPAIV
ncbi:hypothetical protein AB1Y20_005921 [Prymnesium parvum]|uniref:C2 domain-containing protein n=1 Tax=Prymnesium parvum TaxID=97485 RepID=A0AB34J169_PRYPA